MSDVREANHSSRDSASGVGVKRWHRKCSIDCGCLCHDTQGGCHDHHGQPCPGKFR